MHRILYILFCLLVLTRAEAQTDTAKPSRTHADSPLVRLTHADSVHRDSVTRARRARRDSLHQLRLAAQRDSLVAAKRDSLATAHRDSAIAAQRSSPTATGGNSPTAAQQDSLTAVQRNALTAAQRDSAVQRKDSGAAATAHAPAAKPAPSAAPAQNEGPPAGEFWKHVLDINGDFNFNGKPAVGIFEIHHPNSKDSLFYLLVVILFYFALIRIFFEKYFSNLMTLFFRVSLRQQQIREQVLQTPLPSLLLNILFIISAGLYACYLLHYSRFGAGVRFWVLYAYCMVILAILYLGKFVVLKFVGWVFSISRATDIYIFVVFLVNKMLGIFLLPFLILITFSGQDLREVFITISLAMIFVLWTYRALAGYRAVRNEIKLTPFYFFLYLCAFEIAPLLLIYKVLLTNLEKVF